MSKEEDALASLPSVRLAAETDSSLVAKFIVEAKAAVGTDGEWRLFDPSAFEPLASALDAASRGEITHSEWRKTIADALEPMTAHPPVASVKSSLGPLMQKFRNRVPADAHACRLRRALDEVLQKATASGASPGARAAALVRLLHGVRLIPSDSGEDPALRAASLLQSRLLEELSALAPPSLGLAGLVQAPVLRAMGRLPTSLASSLPSSSPTTGSEHFGAGAPPAGGGAADACGVPGADEASVARSVAPVELLLMTAELARRGDQKGSKHGCMIVQPAEVEPADQAAGETSTAGAYALEGPGESNHAAGSATSGRPRETVRILGRGWNHDVYERRENLQRRRVVHAECHAVADAIRMLGEEAAFDAFRRSTCWVVELRDDTGYDNAPPCPKCALLLRACGVPQVVHSTREGTLRTLELPSAKPELLREESACKPLCYACDEIGVRCARLEAALKEKEAASCGSSSEQQQKEEEDHRPVRQRRE